MQSLGAYEALRPGPDTWMYVSAMITNFPEQAHPPVWMLAPARIAPIISRCLHCCTPLPGPVGMLKAYDEKQAEVLWRLLQRFLQYGHVPLSALQAAMAAMQVMPWAHTCRMHLGLCKPGGHRPRPRRGGLQ